MNNLFLYIFVFLFTKYVGFAYQLFYDCDKVTVSLYHIKQLNKTV